MFVLVRNMLYLSGHVYIVQVSMFALCLQLKVHIH